MLFQKLLNDCLEKLGDMLEFNVLSFKLCGFSENTVLACLLDELNMLKVFLVKNNLILKAFNYHHQTYTMERCNTLVERVYSSLNIDAHVGKDT